MAESWQHWEGRVVDGFPLRRYLGGSDHSGVFLTERTGRQPQEAAIKLAPSTQENPEFQISWWEQIAKHPHLHLLELFETGLCQLDGSRLRYCVMEYAEENLSQILPTRPLTPEETSDLLRSVLVALRCLHSQGCVHGHIKPSNIFAVGDQIKLSSDGLCGIGDAAGNLGLHTIYEAPEIASGARNSPGSDVWSLGIVLVEALTQRPPARNEAEPGEPLVPKTLPMPLVEIAAHCLRRNPQDRWTVPQIAARLDQSPATVPGQVAPRSLVTKQVYRYLVVAAFLLLAMAAGPRLLHRYHETRRPAANVDASFKVQSGREQSPTASSSAQNAAAANSSHEPPVRTGGFVPGAVAKQALPVVPRSAANTIHGKVKVKLRLTVDPSGDVVAAKFESRGPSPYFAKLALEAAPRWTFTPPQIDGQNVSSEWVLRFEFARTATNVYPAPVRP